MKKFLRLAVMILVMICLSMGVMACGDRDNGGGNNGGGDNGGGGNNGGSEITEEGAVTDGRVAKDFEAARTDNRTNAYAAYSSNGTKIAEYKSLADAISSAVNGGGLIVSF